MDDLFERVLREANQISGSLIIDSSEKCEEALNYLSDILLNLYFMIDKQTLNEMIDEFLPGVREKESDIPDEIVEAIKSYSQNATNISTSIYNFLREQSQNGESINGIDALIVRVKRYIRSINLIIKDTPNKFVKGNQLYSWIKISNAVLFVINNTIKCVDEYNSTIRNTEIRHEPLIGLNDLT
jgi:hypothetical protein